MLSLLLVLVQDYMHTAIACDISKHDYCIHQYDASLLFSLLLPPPPPVVPLNPSALYTVLSIFSSTSTTTCATTIDKFSLALWGFTFKSLHLNQLQLLQYDVYCFFTSMCLFHNTNLVTLIIYVTTFICTQLYKYVT